MSSSFIQRKLWYHGIFPNDKAKSLFLSSYKIPEIETAGPMAVLFSMKFGDRGSFYFSSPLIIPNVWSSIPKPGWVARALIITSAFCSRKDKEKRSNGQMPVIFCRRFLEVAIQNFHLHLIGWNLVMWSHLAAREAEKLSLFQSTVCSAKIRAFCWRKENVY